MTRTHELDHDRDQDHHRSGDPARAPGRGTRAQDLDGPTGAIPSGIVMRKQRDSNGVEAGAEHALSQASASSGRALPEPLRDKFEQSLGADLSAVRIHDGAASAASASAVGAKAYTVGNDIHFGAGHYDPTSSVGEHLLAHEVAHTVQQSGGIGRKAQFKLEVSSQGDAHEVEADHAADAMIAGGPATVSGASGLARRIMRAEAEGSEGGTEEGASGIGVKPNGTVVLAKIPLGGGAVGPIELEAELEGSIGWVAGIGKAKNQISGPGIAQTHEASDEKVADLKVSNDKIGLEVEREGKSLWGGVTPKYGGSLEVNKDGVGLEGSAGIETKHGGATINLASIKLKLIDLKDKKLEPISLEAESGVQLEPYVINSESGLKLTLTPKGKITVGATPNYTELAEWIAERLATEAAVDAAAGATAAGAAIAAVVLIAIGAEIAISEGDDIYRLCTNAYKAISDYATCYDAAIRNKAGGAADKYGSQGFAQGQLDRQKLLRKYPQDVIEAQADAASGKVVATARARFKSEAEAKFRANHKIMTKVRDGELPPDFVKVLDISTDEGGIGKQGTSAQDEYGRDKVQEMEILQGATDLAKTKVREHLGGKTVQIDPSTAVVGCAGHALEVRRLGYFDSWRPNPAEFVEAQPSGALEINGHDQALAGVDVHAALSPDEKQRAMTLVCEALLQQGRIVVVYRRLPMKDDTQQGDVAAENVERAHDALRQSQIDAMTDGDLYSQPQPGEG